MNTLGLMVIMIAKATKGHCQFKTVYESSKKNKQPGDPSIRTREYRAKLFQHFSCPWWEKVTNKM
jgi:hypothetical protein